jgi:hypothetical protein
MLSRFAPALSCAAWLAAGVATAQPASPTAPAASPTAGDVVVRGHAPTTPETFAKSVEKFVHDWGRPGPIGQISRWAKPVCPLTDGLTPGFNDFVTQRIKEVASRVGAPAPAIAARAST